MADQQPQPMDPRVGEQVAELGRGLAAEPLGGADALSKHSLGGMPPLGGTGGLSGVVSETVAAAGAAVHSAGGALAGAAKAATGAGAAGSEP